jgi:hypothetical protein
MSRRSIDVAVLLVGLPMGLLACSTTDSPLTPSRAATPTQAIAAARAALEAGDRDIDMDGDGRKELHRELDAKGEVVREELDLEGDGKPEMWWTPGKRSFSFQVDRNNDGNVEYGYEVTRDADAPELFHVLRRYDTNQNGVEDERWQYDVRDGDSEISVTIERDENETGDFEVAEQKSIPVDTSNEPREVDLVFDDVPRSCTEAERSRLEREFYDEVNTGLQCLVSTELPEMAAELWYLLVHHRIVIRCTDEIADEHGRTFCARAPGALRALQPDDDVTIEANRLHFEGRCDVPGDMFHELIHYVVGGHHSDGETISSGDPTYNCQALCFGCPNYFGGRACTLDPATADSNCAANRARLAHCFLGRWESGPVQVPDGEARGGDGMRLVLSPDGSGHMDYSATTPLEITSPTDLGSIRIVARYAGSGDVSWRAEAGEVLRIVPDDPSDFSVNLTTFLDERSISEQELPLEELTAAAGTMSGVTHVECTDDGWQLVMPFDATRSEVIPWHRYE